MRPIDADALPKVRFIAQNGVDCGIMDVPYAEIDSAPTIDPIKAAGGCRCRECSFGCKPNSPDMQDRYVYCQQQSKYKEIDAFCSDGEARGGTERKTFINAFDSEQ